MLVKSDGIIFKDKVFYLSRGRRHWLLDVAWAKSKGLRFPEDVSTVGDDLLMAFQPGQQTPLPFTGTDRDISSVGLARQVAARDVTGTGLEIGAGGSPFPVPIECRVIYGDSYDYEELVQNAYHGQAIHDIVAPDIRTNLDTLHNVADGSLDFVVACHVIEHTKSPITAITRCYEKLKVGGRLVLVVPDKEKTFDVDRPVTQLCHLIDDHRRSHPDRDREHFREFFSLARGFQVTEGDPEEYWQRKWSEDYSIHFHTWTYDSFLEMVTWIRAHVAPFRDLWSLPCMPDGIEFYFTLTK